jgi:chaperonin GroEL
VAFLRGQLALDELKVEGDEAIGVNIVRKAVEAPLRQIVANAGGEGTLVVQEVKNGKGNYGYDVVTDQYVDMLEAGIIDPAKVTRYALQNAASIAGLLLTTECMIYDIPEKKKNTQPAPDMDEMM